MSTAVDRQLALSRVGGDADLLTEIARLFLEDYPKVLCDLREALARGDAKSVERTAHGLKGSVSNFGAAEAVEAARTIENLGRMQSLEEAAQMVSRLEAALATIRPELEAL